MLGSGGLGWTPLQQYRYLTRNPSEEAGGGDEILLSKIRIVRRLIASIVKFKTEIIIAVNMTSYSILSTTSKLISSPTHEVSNC